MARLTQALRAVPLVLVAGLALSACGVGGAVTDARASCHLVTKAIKLQERSEAPGLTASQSASLAAQAMAELLKATPAAAAATSTDGSWNALMTTINEAERVPFDELIPSLTRLCRVADSSTPYL